MINIKKINQILEDAKNQIRVMFEEELETQTGGFPIWFNPLFAEDKAKLWDITYCPQINTQNTDSHYVMGFVEDDGKVFFIVYDFDEERNFNVAFEDATINEISSIAAHYVLCGWIKN